jgi:hypothetical protein
MHRIAPPSTFLTLNSFLYNTYKELLRTTFDICCVGVMYSGE